MSAPNSPDHNHETEAALRLHVGDEVFARGAACYREGKVTELQARSARTTATVTGAADHQVEVRRTPRGFEGQCSCPVSEGFDFCHHCVAVALALDAREIQRAEAVNGAPEARLQVYLDDLPREQLIELIARAAHDLPALKERLQLQADIAAGAMDTRRARKMVTAAMPLRRIWQRPKVRRYFAKAVTALNGLLQVAPSMDPDILMNVAEYALERYDSVLERVDDADGNRWFLQDRLRALLAAALARSDWSPQKRGTYLLDRVMRDQRELFDRAMTDFWRVLGDAPRAAFYADAKQRLAELNTGTSDDEFFGLRRNLLLELLRTDATERDDVDALIAINRENLRGSIDRYALARLYLRRNNVDAALEMLDAADARAHSQNRDHGLRVDVHRARGEWNAAADAQVRRLLADPSIDAYQELIDLADQTERKKTLLGSLHKSLRAQLVTGNHTRGQAAQLLARLAFDGGDSDAAFALIMEHVSDANSLVEMAKWFEDDEAVRATQLIDCAVEATIAQKKNWAYKEIVSMIWSHRETFDRLGAQVFASFVADLKVRHKAKRNLVALLEAAAGK